VATVLAFGRDISFGTGFGPPLAFWLADMGVSSAGNHLLGRLFAGAALLDVDVWRF